MVSAVYLIGRGNLELSTFSTLNMQSTSFEIDNLLKNDPNFITREKCWNEDFQKMYGGKLVPPLNDYKELVLKILPVMLTNGTRDDINKFEYGMWEQIADGAYFRSAVATSANISKDSRIQLIRPFKKNIIFFNDLRIYYSNQKFYLKNINTNDNVTIPQIEIETEDDEKGIENLIKEIATRTKSKDIEFGFSWINKIISLNPIDKFVRKARKKIFLAEQYKYDVFISHKSIDFEIAKRLYDYLISKSKKVFLSEISLPLLGSAEFMKKIDEAIEFSKHMIVICSEPQYLVSGWVESEWRMFINEKRSERKVGNFFTIIANRYSIESLPISIRQYDVFPYNQSSIEKSLSYIN